MSWSRVERKTLRGGISATLWETNETEGHRTAYTVTTDYNGECYTPSANANGEPSSKVRAWAQYREMMQQRGDLIPTNQGGKRVGAGKKPAKDRSNIRSEVITCRVTPKEKGVLVPIIDSTLAELRNGS